MNAHTRVHAARPARGRECGGGRPRVEAPQGGARAGVCGRLGRPRPESPTRAATAPYSTSAPAVLVWKKARGERRSRSATPGNGAPPPASASAVAATAAAAVRTVLGSVARSSSIRLPSAAAFPSQRHTSRMGPAAPRVTRSAVRHTPCAAAAACNLLATATASASKGAAVTSSAACGSSPAELAAAAATPPPSATTASMMATASRVASLARLCT